MNQWLTNQSQIDEEGIIIKINEVKSGR